MELAKITAKGQITLPIAIRRMLKLDDGDKVAFIERDGQYILVNPTTLAFENARNAFEGESKKQGLEEIEDVTAMIKEIRASRER
jgi:AbrB family looped-hinge helix DNA binding protein